MDSAYVAQVRAIFVPLGQFLAQFDNGEATKVGARQRDVARKAYWKVFWRQPEIADSVITPTQRALMPMLESMLQVPAREREHSQWFFGHPIKFRDDKVATR
jgi:hypothetical protein